MVLYLKWGPPTWRSRPFALPEWQHSMTKPRVLFSGPFRPWILYRRREKEEKSSELFLSSESPQRRTQQRRKESNDNSWKTDVFYRHSNPPRYAAHVLSPISAWRVAHALNAKICVLRERRLFKLHLTHGTRLERNPRVLRERRLLSSARHVAMPQNASLPFSKTASLKKDHVTTLKSALLQQSKTYVSTSMFASLQYKREKVSFLLQMSFAFPRQHDLCISRLAFSLYFYNQFKIILAQADNYFTLGSTVRQQQAQSIEEVRTTYLDTHNDRFWWLQRV